MCVRARACVILGSVLTVRTLKRNLRHYFLRGRKRRYKGKERKGCRRDEWALSGEQGQCDVETGVSIGEKYAHVRVCALTWQEPTVALYMACCVCAYFLCLIACCNTSIVLNYCNSFTARYSVFL